MEEKIVMTLFSTKLHNLGYQVSEFSCNDYTDIIATKGPVVWVLTLDSDFTAAGVKIFKDFADKLLKSHDRFIGWKAYHMYVNHELPGPIVSVSGDYTLRDIA